MQLKKLAQLGRIASLKREVELAELARIACERDEVRSQQGQLTDAARDARRIGQASATEGKAAERFVGWAELRYAELDSDLGRLIDEMSAQRARAALAVGRQDVLSQIEGRLRNESRQKRAK